MCGWLNFAVTMLLCVSVFASMAVSADASKMGVYVADIMNIDFKIPELGEKNNMITARAGIHNTGSIEYAARVRMDIMSNSDVLFTAWSDEKRITPGQREGFVLYGYRPEASNLSMRTRAYYGNEMHELEPFYIGEWETAETKTAFSVMNFRTYDSYIRFDIMSNQSLEGVVVFPASYPSTWIFEQERIDGLERNAIKEVMIPYETGFFRERDISIVMATEDGSYYQEQVFTLNRETGLMKYVHLLMDFLGGIFRS